MVDFSVVVIFPIRLDQPMDKFVYPDLINALGTEQQFKGVLHTISLHLHHLVQCTFVHDIFVKD
jgi:hypothetical protein